MNPTQLSEPVRLNREGGALEFRRLSPSDILKLREEFRVLRKTQLLESLQLSGITGMDALKVLNQFDARRIPYSAVIEFINTAEGQFQAIRLSLKAMFAGEDDTAITKRFDELNLSAEDQLEVAAGLLNLELKDAPGNPQSADSLNPSIETGGANHPSSDTTSTPTATPSTGQ